MWPLIRWVSVYGQLTSLYSPERVTARPLVASTSEPSPSSPFAPWPRPLPFTPSASLSFSHSLPSVSETCCKPTDKAEADRHRHTHTPAHTRRHFQPTWARYWPGSEAHGTARPCGMWPWRSRCVQMCECLCVCVLLLVLWYVLSN